MLPASPVLAAPRGRGHHDGPKSFDPEREGGVRSMWSVAMWTFIGAGALSAQTDPADLDADLEAFRSEHGLPAVAAMVVSSDGILAEGVAGVRDVGAPDRATRSDLWHVGSITKSFTATLTARLVERGVLSWDDRLADRLPEAVGTDFADVTLAQLASHSAGLPANPPPAWFTTTRRSPNSVPVQRRDAVVAALRGDPVSDPGSGFLYSNLGYMTLGAVLEEVTGETWETLLRREVLEPAGLGTAGFGAPGSIDVLDQPRGHVPGGNGELVAVPGLDNPAALGPAGTLHMSLRDLATWGAVHLRGERGEDGIVPAAAFRWMHRGRAGNYGSGWVDARDASGRRMIWHNGSNTAWYAMVALLPDADRVIAIVTNGSIAAQGPVDGLLADLVRRWAPADGGPVPPPSASGGGSDAPPRLHLAASRQEGMVDPTRELTSTLASADWGTTSFTEFPEETHLTIYHPAALAAFRALFPRPGG